MRARATMIGKYVRITYKGVRHVCRLVLICAALPSCFADSQLQTESLCRLQETIAQGSSRSARVAGVFITGPEGEALMDGACPADYTWVELSLESKEQKRQLEKAIERWGSASVLFEGEFFGPPLPDPKLPEAIKRVYHPGWRHLGAFKTRLIVHSVGDVRRPPKKR